MNDNKKDKKDMRPKQDIPSILSRVKRPKKAVITAGMPYANGPVHIGHLAGAHVPADIFARWTKLLIDNDKVLFVCGTDDHGSNSEVAAKKLGMTTESFIEDVHAKQLKTMNRFSIGLDTYTGTSRKENYEAHKDLCQEFLKKMHSNNMLEKKTSKQWYDPKMDMFLPDRFVQGKCPNENCDNTKAYSDDCDVCGTQYDPSELIDPVSTISNSTPVLKDTDHWFLDMWKVTDQLIEWLNTKQRTWRKSILQEVLGTVYPCVTFTNKMEDAYKEIKESLPTHKSRYAPGRKVLVQFENLADLSTGKKLLEKQGITCELNDGWAHRSITRDVSWGIPVPTDIESGMENKTLYVWPESLIAPISFTKVALKNKGLSEDLYKDYWCDPEAKVYQFLGTDNVFFYVLMQGSMWFGVQEDPMRQAVAGELQQTEIFSNFHLQINGEKMSKSKGNFYSGDQLIDEMGYSADQIRYFLASLSLSEKASNFDFEVFNNKNQFLAGPLNASFEKPISACNAKFEGVVPTGKLIGKTEKETLKIIQQYTKFMEKAEYPKALGALENYARIINGLFNQYKPHDDRYPLEERSDALYSSFYILRNILIMLSPFAPETMEKLRKSLNLPESIYALDELKNDFPQNHKIGEQVEYFPSVSES
ncbi:methionine--tRNA ligase [Halobacteriovorax sp. HLS]|uniref:methionine--tRNA ligase n=1 Tax=Halobacteriovorax sp. HLS TaxID=2234000 RepID=UPI000FD9EB58|nr:class I tRNA ligase family protein [Halobacteriovorax sp. HLS]